MVRQLAHRGFAKRWELSDVVAPLLIAGRFVNIRSVTGRLDALFGPSIAATGVSHIHFTVCLFSLTLPKRDA